ncbi:MAG: aldehyde dehydrogenase family protein [Actinobacteria bacterium]|nr:aldehyde dehydrogenase family protein [Actinomycetota bacterium]
MPTTTPISGTIAIPEAERKVEHDSLEQIDKLVAEVAGHRDAWLALGIDDRIRLLGEAIEATLVLTEMWDRAARAPKHIADGSAYDGEDLGSGPWALIRNLKLLRNTLTDIRDHGEVRFPGEPFTRPDGQVVVPVFPTSKLDQVVLAGLKGEVWLQPHVTLDTVTAAPNYLGEKGGGGVCFVLGAGNVAPIGAMDCLHKLYAEDEVCVLKMNPVNEHMGPLVERAMEPFIREGYLRVVYGGIEQGVHLTNHELITSIHITGSDKTHDAIVFGPGAEGADRKRANEPLLDKPITSELGNVTPIIVVPGPWSDADIQYQAKHIATMLTNNCGFNCAAGRMIVTHRRWAKRDQLLDAIRAALAEAPTRHAYYPGAEERWKLFTDAHPEAETYGDPAPGELPWTLVADLDPDATDDIAYRTEAFTSLFCEVPLDVATDVAAFLYEATRWCNDNLWGTLAATVLIHPKTQKDAENAAALDRAIADLRYGTVAVNAWAALGYGITTTPWGGFPGHTLDDIGSGIGFVHNTFLLQDVQKGVARGPWRLGKKPPGSYDFTTMPQLIRKLLRLEAYDDWRQVPGIVLDGIRA